MRGWRTAIHLRGGEGMELSSITSYKFYNMQETKAIIEQIRAGEKEEGKPRRKLKPISRYLLEEMIRKYFKNEAPRGTTLEKIEIEDNRHNET